MKYKTKQIGILELLSMALTPIFGKAKQMHNNYLASHYLMCAQVEEAKAKEAFKNAAYYHKASAIARSKARD